MRPFDALASLLCPILIVATLGYLGTSVARPYGHCRRCKGAGSIPAMLGRRRPCRRCQTTGIRLRIGRRFLNYLHRAHRDATKGQATSRGRRGR